MIGVLNELTIYEIDGEDIGRYDRKLDVKSHRSRQEFVVIEIEKKRYTVSAKDLKAAIENATNTAKW